VPEFVVPEIVDDEFREHYRGLIQTSLLRTVEAERGRRVRRVRRRRHGPAAAKPVSRSRLRLAAPAVWALAVVLLVVDAIVFGLESWATGVADVGVVALTAVWFLAASANLRGPIPVPAAVAEPVEDEPAPADPSQEDDSIAGLELVRLPMQRDGGGHVTDLLAAAPFSPAGWQMVACRAGALRGMHAHTRAEDLRIIVQGRVALGLRDLRAGSPSSERSALLELSGEDYCAVRIPAGVAHGIYAVSDAHLLVGLSAVEEDDELGCAWNDPGLGIVWPGEPLFLSERDRNAGPLSILVEELRKEI